MIKSYLIACILFLSTVFSSSAENSPLPCLNKKFSIVVHVVKDIAGNTNVLESDILLAIDTLNSHFTKICVSFEVCEFRMVENFQYDELKFDEETDELIVKNSIKNRINMYFITADEESPNVCGKATLGGIATGGNIYILKRCIGPGDFTIPHEMGHFFGLSHTFEEPASQIVDGTNCEITGDSICDTPADPYIDGENIANYVSNCRFTSEKKDGNGDFYDPDVSNIMSYYPCKCDFTNEQYIKMVNTYLSSYPKNW
jgi:hypothetical protein